MHALRYPETPREALVETLHGVEVADPYRWLEELDAPATRAWIAAQNTLTEELLSRIPAREALRRRLTELWDYEKFGVPLRRGGRYVYTYNNGLQNQSVLCWQEGLTGEARVLLDPNLLSNDGTVALMGYALSHDGALLAYGLSAAGSDWQEWRVREVTSGRDLDDHLRWVKFSGAAWTADGAGFFYSRYDAPPAGEAYRGANRNQKLFFHRLGTPQEQDVLIYARPDRPEWGFSPTVTDDGRYLVVTVWQGTHRENGVLVRDLQADGPITELLLDFDASYEFIGNVASRFYFLTDRDAPLGRVIAIDLDRPQPQAWHAILPESGEALQSVSLIGGRLVAVYLRDAAHRLAIFGLDGRFEREIALPGPGTVAGVSGEQDDPDAFFLFTSFTMPGTVVRCNVVTGECTVFRAPQLRFDPDAYRTEQVFVTSRDGTRVPVFLTYRRDRQPGSATPTYLYGYGGFNVSLTPAFSVEHLVWMERGGIYAQAILRGGGEYGKAWHLAGTKLHKQNVFDDFIAVAEWLIANGYTSAARLAIGGRSNGGLLVGACLTQRPELFGACLVGVGVLDMLRFHRWTIGWAWVSDYGSPDNPEEFRALLAYSPYHNVRPGVCYPATLITTGDHDDRVYPAHSFKFAAALQAAQACERPILIRIETRAGHGAGKPTAKLIDEAAARLAFVSAALEMERDDERK